MTTIRFAWEDIASVKRVENAMGMLSSGQAKLAEQRAVNRVGDMAKTKVIRALAIQTGLKQKIIRKAVKVNRASGAGKAGGSIEYVMTTRGGDISLKFFSARETRAGASAAPFGARKVFAGSFIKGGKFPNRVAAKGLHGHVYRRTGAGRGPLALLNSGVIIPEQMVIGESASSFNATVEANLPRRVMHEIQRLAPGIFD